VSVVCNYLDQAISELDNMENLVTGYKIHLNVSGLSIFFVKSCYSSFIGCRRRYLVHSIPTSRITSTDTEPAYSIK
jgi:hypothetical protein